MVPNRSGYHLHHDRARPCIEEISINEVLPADSVAVTSSSTTPTISTPSGPGSGYQSGPVSPASPPTEAGEAPPRPYSSTLTKSQKHFILFIATLVSFFSALSSRIYYPILPTLVENYSLTTTLLNLSITTYMLLQGVAPVLVGPFSDKYGRRAGYILCLVIHILSNICLAIQNSYPALMVLRGLQALGASGLVSLGYVVVSDIAATPKERQKFTPILAGGVLFADILGPVLGGLLGRYAGWRSVFWFLAAAAGGLMLVYWLFVPEMKRSAIVVAGNGDQGRVVKMWWMVEGIRLLKRADFTDDDNNTIPTRAQRISSNPREAVSILLEPTAFILILSIGLLMLMNIAFRTSTPTLFSEIYGFDSLQIGLCFLPLGIGASIGAICNGYLLDWNYRRHAGQLNLTETSNPEEPEPGAEVETERTISQADLPTISLEKARLQPLVPLLLLTISTITPYGFVLSRTQNSGTNLSIAIPLVLQALNSFALSACANTLTTLLIDLFPSQPATAAATAAKLVQCWLGAIGAGVVQDMLLGLGREWCFVLLGGLVALAGLGACVI
ncbi:major facilitator superfamily domain-containing protein [Aspergillus unguis]